MVINLSHAEEVCACVHLIFPVGASLMFHDQYFVEIDANSKNATFYKFKRDKEKGGKRIHVLKNGRKKKEGKKWREREYYGRTFSEVSYLAEELAAQGLRVQRLSGLLNPLRKELRDLPSSACPLQACKRSLAGLTSSIIPRTCRGSFLAT